jgi:hypothetical protein
MGPGIVIPVLIVTVAVPVVLLWARQRFKGDGSDVEVEDATAPGGRLTGNALRSLPSPPWRVVYEIAHDKLGGVEHVLIGPGGIFAVVTSMEPMPLAAVDSPDAHQMAGPAIRRGALDDALRRCAMTSDRLATVHWGVSPSPHPPALDVLPGAVAVDGRQLEAWADGADVRGGNLLSAAQVDLAWQTVVTAIGRPDPLG